MGAVDINQVVLIGRLTRDAELKYTANGQAICKFSIAVNYKKKEGENWIDNANFFDVTLWGRQGEAINQYLIKGKRVGLQGELRQDRWEQDGQNRSKVGVIANSVELLDGGGEQHGNSGGSYGGGNGYSGSRGNNGNTGSRQSSTPPQNTRENDDGFTDDIPF